MSNDFEQIQDNDSNITQRSDPHELSNSENLPRGTPSDSNSTSQPSTTFQTEESFLKALSVSPGKAALQRVGHPVL